MVTCIACHNDVTIAMNSVTFPSGPTVENVGDDSRCMTCHQGRESTVSVNEALTGLPDDEVSEKIRFLNVHYRAAGATRYGTQAKGAYEYAGLTYRGYYLHDEDSQSCADCHEQHTLKVKVEVCGECHRKPETIAKKSDMQLIRRTKMDHDGDGNVQEGMGEELEAVHAKLLVAIQIYATAMTGKPIIYDGHSYPYFFNDKNGNGKNDRGEAIYPNRYQSWTSRLLRAAYNYQFAAKDPGVYTHNPMYVIQTLHDSLADLSSKVDVDMAGMVRPE